MLFRRFVFENPRSTPVDVDLYLSPAPPWPAQPTLHVPAVAMGMNVDHDFSALALDGMQRVKVRVVEAGGAIREEACEVDTTKHLIEVHAFNKPQRLIVQCYSSDTAASGCIACPP